MNFFQVFVNLFQFNRTNWKAVTLCLLAAIVFWLFNSLNKTHTTNIHFPVQYEYDQQKFVPAETLPRQVTLNVSGNGWDLFRKHFGIKLTPLEIRLDKPEVRRIAGASLLSSFGAQLSNLQINFVVTDSLRIVLDERASRKFKLAANTSGVTYKKGFGRISPIVILPDSVELQGPKSLLNKIPDSLTLRLSEKRVSENVREEVEVITPSGEFINRNPPIAEVMFEVGELVEQIRWIKLNDKNLPWGNEIIKDSLQVSFLFPLRHTDQLKNLPLSATLNVADLKRGESRYITPAVEGMPSWLKVIRIDSVMVKRY